MTDLGLNQSKYIGLKKIGQATIVKNGNSIGNNRPNVQEKQLNVSMRIRGPLDLKRKKMVSLQKKRCK